VSIDDITECPHLNRLVLQELRNTDQVFRPADAKGCSHEVLGAQNARLDRVLLWIDPDFNVFGLSQRLGVKVVCDRQKLDSPTFDDQPLLVKLRISLLPKMLEDGLERDQNSSGRGRA
jgi:hypothetical protein